MGENTLTLKSLGIHRHLDKLNRIVIPREIIKRYEKEEEKLVGFAIQDTEENVLLFKPIYE